MNNLTFGIIGLGKMGGNLGIQAHEKGFGVVGFDPNPSAEIRQHGGISLANSIESLVEKLPAPRMIFLYVPAGEIVDQLSDQLSDLLQQGDIIIDGGNSYWGNSITRHSRLAKKGIHFVDCGTSGGLDGARNGACFMAGGDKEAVDLIAPILKALSVPNGFIYTGASGSGHYVKLVHNGIEFGMLQAIGEGVNLLTSYKDTLNIPEILHVWNHGSVIRSWLVELMWKVYNQKDGFESVPAYIEDTGEVNWLVNDAMRMEVAIPVIAQSVMQLFASRDQANIWAKGVAMMRHGFGGHPFGEDEAIRHERQFGKIENAQTSNLYKKSK
jgi:6-phosphogluconate dehydrogenase